MSRQAPPNPAGRSFLGPFRRFAARHATGRRHLIFARSEFSITLKTTSPQGSLPGAMARACSRASSPHRIEAARLALPLRPLTALAQEQESGSTSGQTRSRRGLGEMTRRKREIVGLTNEQDFPHLVELAVPPGGFRGAFLEFDAGMTHPGSPRSESTQGRAILYSILLRRYRHRGCIPQSLRWRVLDLRTG